MVGQDDCGFRGISNGFILVGAFQMSGAENISEKLRRAESAYARQTMRPAIAILVIVPLLTIYEIGTIVTGNRSARSGFEQLLFSFLEDVPSLIMSFACLGILLVWHRRCRDHWEFDARHLPIVVGEAVVLGAMIFFAVNAIRFAFAAELQSVPGVEISLLDWMSIVSRYCGTSVFEEIWFRPMLLGGIVWLLKRFSSSFPGSLSLAIVLSSLLFSALHYVNWNPAGDPFDWLGFVCRFLLGVAFSLIFLFRGLSVAVLSHLVYNVLFLTKPN
jgi:Type II CAAX prenyl endopeptidase Rce1-like